MSPRVLNRLEQLERENTLLDSALQLIENDGIAMLTIDKLVKEVPFSKGTVYNHFNSKEDLLLGLCNRCMGALADLFQRAVDFDGCLREKALAIQFAYMLYARLYTTQFMLVITAKSATIVDKSNPSRHEEHVQLEGKLMYPAVNLFQQAIENGDMPAPTNMDLKQLTFAFWSLGFGTNALLVEDVHDCSARSSLVLEREMLNSINILLDGLSFKPLSKDHNWSLTLKKLKQETFSKEVHQLSARGITLAI